MSAEAFHIRKIKNFKFKENLKFEQGDKLILSIDVCIRKSFQVDGINQVIPLKMQYRKEIKEKVLIEDHYYENYISPKNFYGYYFENQNLLIINAHKALSNTVFKILEDSEYKVQMEKFTFDFKKILENKLSHSKGISFKKDDVKIRSKSFHGDKVETDPEAKKALDEDKVTSIIVSFDINNKSKTIHISKISSISVSSKCESKEKYIELVFNAFNILKTLS